ncbi:hypothetical protein ABIB37_000363 [Agrococcus sp. UYP10]|uniref:hypothetical protein n=1 Tax=Agrococcus sp. UYP10 TaxID=1756355 RepID=UPI0033929C29
MTDEAGAPRVEPEPADVEPADVEPAPLVSKRRGRRVSTEPTPGYTGEPPVERHQSSENDEQLRRDVPPHWG